jgi:cytochrome P450
LEPNISNQLILSTLYNLFLHPLSSQPGPLLCRISGLPSFYHACLGDRHIWTWRLFQQYGDKFRAAPNLLLFRTPEAYNAIFAMNANVKRSGFYEVWRRHGKDVNTLAVTDVAVHAQRRKALGLAFTDQSVKATIPFIERHVDRWNVVMPGETVDGEGWSEGQDMSKWTEYLMIDTFGDVCFGRQNGTMEREENDLKVIPANIARYLRVYNPVGFHV